MRAATAYFAGVGTVAVAIAAGLGGGLLLGNIMSPQQPKYPSSEVTRLERSASTPIPAASTAASVAPVVAPVQAAAAVEPPAPPPQQASSPQPQPEPKLQQASTQPVEPPKPAERSTKAQPVAVSSSPAVEPSAARTVPEDSFAKAREADLRRDARRADDRRKSERRQQWADKRKWRQHGDDELRDVEAAVRDDTEQRFGRSEVRQERSEPRTLFGREGAFGSGRVTLFDD